MKPIPCTLLLFVLLFGTQTIRGQAIPHVPGQILVSLLPEAAPEPIVSRFHNSFPDANLSLVRQVAGMLNIWLLEARADETATHNTLSWLNRQPEVRVAQYNHLLEERQSPPDLLPNDPNFALQWQHVNSGAGGGVPNADFDSDLAWNVTTGGLTPKGDTIVVSVIDGGIQDTHEDLTANMWHNFKEIPGDSIDNDANGYVDDYRGWNVYGANDKITGLATGHGTPVSAIVGAKGNNGIGVAGINWDVKILFVAGSSDEATILSAYDYVLRARRRYNASDGQSGAFVVAVNCSWGITYGQPGDAPLWCAAFDTLGAAGILSVAATANTALDVDEKGDLPTACPSDYLISVTSLTKADVKAANAAWGAVNIDLGAYGQSVYTAGAGNVYGSFEGTSFAAPQVSGAVGLLYSAPCSNLIDMAKADPAAAALWVKAIILGSATPNASLQGKTVTGGRLNLNNMIQDYEDQCAVCLPPFGIMVSNITDQQALLKWSNVADVQSVSLRWRKVGDLTWTLISMAQNPYTLSGLSACTDYEVAFRGACGGAVSNWSPPVAFHSDGCCAPPSGVSITAVTGTGATLDWSDIIAASAGYQVRLQPDGGASEELQSNQSTLVLDGLAPCTEYHFWVKSLCSNENSSWSAPYEFWTAGCGACIDKVYCLASGGSAQDEWISSVSIGAWKNDSGGSKGYQDFTDSSLTNKLILLPGTPLPVLLTPSFSGLPYKEYFRVYIDYNADGNFDAPDELAFDPGFASDAQVSGQITPPVFSASGFTRMRVLMKYLAPQGIPPAACENFEFGQVEDYCVHLGLMTSVTNGQEPLTAIPVYPQPASTRAYLRLPEGLSGTVDLHIYDVTGNSMLNESRAAATDPLEIDVQNWPAGVYLIRFENDGRVFQQKLLKI